MNFLRLLLWPILWWGFSEALYCQDAPKPRVILTAEQFEQLEKLAADMRAINDDENRTIIADGATIAALNTSAQQLNAQLAAARKSGEQAEQEAAQLARDAIAAQAKVKREAHAKWFWFFVALAEAIFICRKPLARLAGIPIP